MKLNTSNSKTDQIVKCLKLTAKTHNIRLFGSHALPHTSAFAQKIAKFKRSLLETEFKTELENFIVISSPDGQNWSNDDGFNYIANVREGNEIEFYNDLYKVG